MNILRRLLKDGGKKVAREAPRISSRHASRSVNETLEALGVPYHENLVRDQANISQIIREKQKKFLENPYSVNCFRDYITVLTVFGFESEALEETRNLTLYQCYKLTFDGKGHHPKKRFGLIHQYYSLQLKSWRVLFRLIGYSVLALYFMGFFSSTKENIEDAMGGIVSRIFAGDDPKPTSKPSVRFSDIIVI